MANIQDSKVVAQPDTSEQKDRLSKIVKSFDMLSQTMSNAVVAPPAGLFGIKITIKSGGVTIDGSTLDVEFDVPFDDNTEANEAEITVYNLSPTTRAHLFYDQPITITAGYGSDTGTIFSGRISAAPRSTHVGVDLKTTITALDDKSLKERDIASIAFKAGTKASYILRTLLSKVGLPVVVFRPRKDYTYKDASNVDGGLMQNVQKYAKVCGISAFILQGQIYAMDVRDSNGPTFNLSVDTGLIDAPEYYEEEIKEDNYTETRKGYKIKMLLQHHMMVGSIINLNSKDAKGKFHVLEGKHSYDGMDFITEVTAIQ